MSQSRRVPAPSPDSEPLDIGAGLDGSEQTTPGSHSFSVFSQTYGALDLLPSPGRARRNTRVSSGSSCETSFLQDELDLTNDSMSLSFSQADGELDFRIPTSSSRKPGTARRTNTATILADVSTEPRAPYSNLKREWSDSALSHEKCSSVADLLEVVQDSRDRFDSSDHEAGSGFGGGSSFASHGGSANYPLNSSTSMEDVRDNLHSRSKPSDAPYETDFPNGLHLLNNHKAADFDDERGNKLQCFSIWQFESPTLQDNPFGETLQPQRSTREHENEVSLEDSDSTVAVLNGRPGALQHSRWSPESLQLGLSFLPETPGEVLTPESHLKQVPNVLPLKRPNGHKSASWMHRVFRGKITKSDLGAPSSKIRLMRITNSQERAHSPKNSHASQLFTGAGYTSSPNGQLRPQVSLGLDNMIPNVDGSISDIPSIAERAEDSYQTDQLRCELERSLKSVLRDRASVISRDRQSERTIQYPDMSQEPSSPAAVSPDLDRELGLSDQGSLLMNASTEHDLDHIGPFHMGDVPPSRTRSVSEDGCVNHVTIHEPLPRKALHQPEEYVNAHRRSPYPTSPPTIPANVATTPSIHGIEGSGDPKSNFPTPRRLRQLTDPSDSSANGASYRGWYSHLLHADEVSTRGNERSLPQIHVESPDWSMPIDRYNHDFNRHGESIEMMPYAQRSLSNGLSDETGQGYGSASEFTGHNTFPGLPDNAQVEPTVSFREEPSRTSSVINFVTGRRFMKDRGKARREETRNKKAHDNGEDRSEEPFENTKGGRSIHSNAGNPWPLKDRQKYFPKYRRGCSGPRHYDQAREAIPLDNYAMEMEKGDSIRSRLSDPPMNQLSITSHHWGDGHGSPSGQRPSCGPLANARDWSKLRKRFAAVVICANTTLIGLTIGIYAGEVPAIQYRIADLKHYAILGNVVFYLGLAIPTFFCWTLPLFHGRRMFSLTALVVFSILQFPQTLIVASPRSPEEAKYRMGLLTLRAFSGVALGFLNINLMGTLMDLFGASLHSRYPHQEMVSVQDVRRHGGGMGIWLGVWTWCHLVSIGFGFLFGALIIDGGDPANGFLLVQYLSILMIILNLAMPEVLQSSGVDLLGRDTQGLYSVGPKLWWDETQAGLVLMWRMSRQLGFSILALYQSWLYGQTVMVIVLLGRLMSKSYHFKPPLVGLCVAAVPIGAALAIFLQKGPSSRQAKQTGLGNGIAAQRQLTWSSHLIRRTLSIGLFPFAGLGYVVTSSGPPIHYIVPTLLAALIGFLSTLAAAECNGMIMETFDTSDLHPDLAQRTVSVDPKDRKMRRLIVSTCHPRINAAIAIIHMLSYICAAGITGLGGPIARNLGIQATTGIVDGVSFVLTVLLTIVLWRGRKAQVVPSHDPETGPPLPGQAAWQVWSIGNPVRNIRRMNILELGSQSRWTEIRRKNRLL
ncbi:MAG: hypothetical protein M1837_001522 [Sclerophora amabilis]|nr:MAG: hypothetical protein M1837_001522 [Sclerophora amabilis]